MKLTKKYEEMINDMGDLIDQAPRGLENQIGIGLILRQVIELHQRIDDLSEMQDDLMREIRSRD